MELAQRIEHTLLKPEATVKDIMRLCDEAQKYHLYAVCVNPCYDAAGKASFAGHGSKSSNRGWFSAGCNFQQR